MVILLGAGLGLNAIFGLDVKWGAAITAIFAILIFVSKSGQKIMDVVSMILGIVMILVGICDVCFLNPPMVMLLCIHLRQNIQ